MNEQNLIRVNKSKLPPADRVGFLVALVKNGKESAHNARDLGSMPGLGRSLEKRIATHSSILAWRTPRTEEPGATSAWGLKESDGAE